MYLKNTKSASSSCVCKISRQRVFWRIFFMKMKNVTTTRDPALAGPPVWQVASFTLFKVLGGPATNSSSIGEVEAFSSLPPALSSSTRPLKVTSQIRANIRPGLLTYEGCGPSRSLYHVLWRTVPLKTLDGRAIGWDRIWFFCVWYWDNLGRSYYIDSKSILRAISNRTQMKVI